MNGILVGGIIILIESLIFSCYIFSVTKSLRNEIIRRGRLIAAVPVVIVNTVQTPPQQMAQPVPTPQQPQPYYENIPLSPTYNGHSDQLPPSTNIGWQSPPRQDLPPPYTPPPTAPLPKQM